MYKTVAALFVITAGSVFGQNSVSGFSGSAHYVAPRPFEGMGAVTNAPYSGEQVNENVQTLADGTHITRTSTPTKVYRDSMGRTRTERPLMGGGLQFPGQLNRPAAPVIAEILDPVGKVKYTLDPINKVAHRQELPAPPARVAKVAAGPARTGVAGGGVVGIIGQATEVARPQMNREQLGERSIEGVLAEGTRDARTIPVGSQGNDREFSVTNEVWMAKDLKLMVLSRNNDPRNGENTQKLINISQSEPDAGLFLPPPDYTVVDEKGDFTINWGPARQ
jgi:hypothetical protein